MGVVLEMPKALSELKARREARRRPETPSPARPRKGSSQSSRNALLAKVHIAKKQLGLSDDDWRGVLDARFGVSSSAKLSVKDLSALSAYLEDRGWTPTPRKKVSDRHGKPHILAHDDSGLSREGRMKKIEALLTELGKQEGRYVPWSYAAAILKHQTGLERLEHAMPEQLGNVIAALSNNVARKKRKQHGIS